MTIEHPKYLGDGAYVGYLHGLIVVYTDSGFGPENIVYLDPDHIKKLVDYLSELPNLIKQKHNQ